MPAPSEENAASPPGLDDFLCFSVYSTGLAFNRVYKPLLDEFGLTYSQYLLLVALAAREGQTVSELGEQLYLESNTLTPLIKRLEAAGLVSRKRDTRDERVVRVSLSPAGTEIIRRARTCVPTQVRAAAGMGQDEMDALIAQMDVLRRKLLEAARGEPRKRQA